MLRISKESGENYVGYKEAVAFVESFSNISAKQGESRVEDPAIFVNRTRFILGLFGHPEKRLSFVHIAGTAGKGTTAALVHKAFVRSGIKAGLFTSPYATTAIEEIQIDGLYIAPADFVDIVESLKPAIEQVRAAGLGAPIASELFFVIALLYFARQGCQWAVIEAGIGGRYDATNVIPAPRVSVVTCIDYDHTKILGKTLRQIAADKSGIIKKGSAFFTFERRPSLLKLFSRRCKEEGATFHHIKGSSEELAAAVASRLGLERPGSDTALPCRFEVMSRSPFVVLDGAHDRVKMRHTAGRLQRLSYKKLILIIGAAGITPDTARMFPEIVPLADRVIITTLSAGKRSLSHPNAIAPFVRSLKKKGVTAESVADPHKALAKALFQASREDCVLVTGAFFLAGELRTGYVPERFILKERKSFR